MKNKLCLIGAILSSMIFISLLLEIIGEVYNGTSEFKLKKVIYLIGWLALSISLYYQHIDKQ